MTGPFVYSCLVTKGTQAITAVEALGGSAGIIPDEPHIATHADRHEGFLEWLSLQMLTVTVNSACNKQGMGINGKTHNPLGPQQTREWKNKRSTAWKRQDVRLGGEERPPGN